MSVRPPRCHWIHYKSLLNAFEFIIPQWHKMVYKPSLSFISKKNANDEMVININRTRLGANQTSNNRHLSLITSYNTLKANDEV